MSANATLLYLYGVVAPDAPTPPHALTGVDDTPVRLLPVGEVAAIVSDVARGEYEESVLDQRMSDVGWVGERGVAHERVLTWFVDRGPVVPFTLFSLHAGEDQVRRRITERVPALRSALEQVRGRREWGIKLWRDDVMFLERLGELSPALQNLEAEIRNAAPGRRFLLERKRDTLRVEESRRISAVTGETVYTELAASAVDARAIPLPAPARSATRVLVLHAAFLVDDLAYGAFEQRVQSLAALDVSAGFEWEFTGPWPPYHFVSV